MGKLSWERVEMKHYDFIKEWWVDHDWDVVPPSILTNEGIVVYKDDTPIFAGWLLLHGTDMCFFEWIVSNKKATKEQKSGGFKYLLQIAETLAKYNGAKFILHMTNNNKLVEMMKSQDYKVTDENCTHLLKQI